MPLTRPFPGPRTALAWHFVRYHQWRFVALFSMATLFGALLGRDATPNSSSLHVSLVTLIMGVFTMIDMFDSHTATTKLRLRMPVATATILQVEALCYSGGLTLAGACYWLTFHLAAPPSVTLGASQFLLLPCVGLYLQAWDWILRSGNKLLAGLTIFGLPVVVVLVLIAPLFHRHLRPLESEHTLLAFAIGAVGAYFVSLHLARDARFQTISKTRPIKAVGVDRSLANAAPRVAPFTSAAVAQVWLERKNLRWPDSSILSALSVCAICLLCAPSIFADIDSVALRLPDLGLLLGIILLTIRMDSSRGCLDFQLPLSDWKLSLHFLRFAFGSLVLATVTVGVTSQAWFALVGSESSLSLTALLLMLWAAWSGLALGVALMFVLLPWMCMEQAAWPALEFAGVCVFGLFLTAAILLATYPNQRRYTPGVCVALAAVFAVVAGNFALLYAATGPAPNAVSRELLGAFLILAFTYHHVELGRIPARAGWKLAGLLLASVMAVCAFHALAPPGETAPSLTAVLFTLGVVPPVFLPFLIQPQSMAWQRFSIEFQKNWKRSAQWLK